MITDDISDLLQLGLSKRVYNAIWRNGIDSIGFLAALDSEELLKIKGLGEKGLAEISDKLTKYLELHPYLIQNREHIGEEDIVSQKDQPPKKITRPSIEDILAILSAQHPLELLELPIRPYNALRRAGIDTIEHLVLMNEDGLLEVRNLGEKSLRIIQDELRMYLEHHPLPKEYADLVDQYKSSQLVKLPLADTSNTVQAVQSTLLIEPTLLDRASCLPLDSISIARLAISEYLHHESFSYKIESVSDLIQIPVDKFKDAKPIQKRVRWYIDWLLTQPEIVWEEEIKGDNLSPVYTVALEETPLDGFVADWFAVLTYREQQIIYGRYGLLRGKVLTLEQLGDQFGVTRERIRQIQKRAEGKLKKPINFQKIRPLTELFHYELVGAGGFINAQQLKERLCKILWVGEVDPLGVANLIFELDNSSEHLKGLYGREDKDLSLTQIKGIQKYLAVALEQERAPLITSRLITKFKGMRFYQEHADEFDDATIEACLESHPKLRLKGELWYLKKRGWLSLSGIIQALRQIGEPAHYKTITEQTNALLPANLHRIPHNIHAELGRRPDIFVRVGQGIFGLVEWGLSDDGCVANAAYRILIEAGKPLHHEVITDSVLETWRVSPGSVYAALSLDERFINIGNGIYWIRDIDLPEASRDFGDLFGTKLVQRQKEIEHWDNGVEYDTHDEVDLLRDMGTDFFGG
ncbi:MAG TPA: hypothetical protein ENN32_03605 [Chloroflexi bacterium]|nr:hypothetical protein [Chloroflexota bacterium]